MVQPEHRTGLKTHSDPPFIYFLKHSQWSFLAKLKKPVLFSET